MKAVRIIATSPKFECNVVFTQQRDCLRLLKSIKRRYGHYENPLKIEISTP